MTDTIEAPALAAPGSVEWHRLRQLGVGSSESPVLFGKGFKDQSLLGLYLSKVLPAEQLADKPGTKVQRRGTRFEGPMLETAADERGWTLVQYPTQIDAHGDPMVSSTDRIVVDALGFPIAPTEGKTAGYHTEEWGDPDVCPDAVPERVNLQVQHQLEVGLDHHGVRVFPEFAYVVACIRHFDDLRIYEVPRSRVIGAEIRRRIRHFWTTYVLPRVAPPLDGSDAGKLLLHMEFPRDTRPELRRVPDDHPVVELVRKHGALHAAKAAADDAMKAVAQQIQHEVGEYAGIVTPLGTVTWKKNRDGQKTDYQAVAADLQRELADATCEETAVKVAAAAVARNTTTTEGARSMRGPWSKKS